MPKVVILVENRKEEEDSEDLIVDFISIDNFEAKVKKLFEQNYVIVQGDIGAILRLEEEVYPPDTRENNPFLGMILPTTPPLPLFFAKRNKNLKQFICEKNENIEKNFDKLILLTFLLAKGNYAIAEGTFIKEKSRQQSIHQLVKQIKSTLSGLEVV